MNDNQTNYSAPSYPPEFFHDDELTLKDMILKMITLGNELKRRYGLILICALLVGGLFLKNSISKNTTYTSGVSFLVDEPENYEQGGIISPIDPSLFRIVENNKITELARSSKIIHSVLLEKKIINNEYDYIANHLIDLYQLDRRWEKEPLDSKYDYLALSGFYFTRDSVEVFTPKELRALSILHDLISGNLLTDQDGLMSISYNQRTEIFKLNITAEDESLSLQLMESILQRLRNFYVDETVGKPKRLYEKISVQVDSIYGLLTSMERKEASIKDQRGFTSSMQELNLKNLTRDIKFIEQEHNTLLSAEKNLEFILDRDTPEFLIIDRTYFPVRNQASKLNACILGLLLGGFLSVTYVVISKIIRDAMAS